MKILGVDPGKNTGWGIIEVIDKQIKLGGAGTSTDTTCMELSDHIKDVHLVVIEGWLTRPKEASKGAFDWDPMITPEVIGNLKTLCRIHGTEFLIQQPSLKPVGYGFLGKSYKKGKPGMHMWDALAHAVFHAVKNLGAKPPAATGASFSA